MKNKICKRCLATKCITKFYSYQRTRNGKTSTYISPSCKICDSKRSLESRKRLKDGGPTLLELRLKPHGTPKDSTYQISHTLQHRFGISLSDYNLMLSDQNYCCAICGKSQEQFTKRLSVDHNHQSGKIRKLLCHYCNHGLGQFFDNPEFLQKAIDYLKNQNVKG